jgi:predicted transposase YbfD/YdcC
MTNKARHKLIDILVIAVAAILCGADDWVAIETFGKARKSWFKRFLELPNGIPSHDTIGRVFSLLSTEAFERCFIAWMGSLLDDVGDVIAVDGKTVRRSHDRSRGRSAIHVVSAFATDAGVALGQVKTEEKSNEIRAIPELLKALDIKGCTITIDAMGCQKAIAEQIIEQEGNYLLSLKGNQGKLHDDVLRVFGEADAVDFRGYEMDYHETSEKGHGRLDLRRYWTLDSREHLSEGKPWAELKTIAVVESERTANGKTTSEMRYYIGSISNSAKEFARCARAHWGIENSLHWVLDIAFREDESRVRINNAAANLSILRKIALNAVKQDKATKLGVKNKRLKAGWDDDYLAKLLLGL